MDNVHIYWSKWIGLVSVLVADRVYLPNGDVTFTNIREYDIETIGL